MKIEFKSKKFRDTVDSLSVGTIFKVKGDMRKVLYMKTDNCVSYEKSENGEVICNCLCLPTLTPMVIFNQIDIEPVYYPEKIIFE